MNRMEKWDYSKVSDVCYSDQKEESYKKASEFLGDTVEDWGCGTAWARRYFKNYRGVDIVPSKWNKNIADLTDYTSDVENILLRQVIECSKEWDKILENAKKSFRKKLCLVICTPRARVTHWSNYGMRFKKKDILDMFPESEFKVKEEDIKTDQYCKTDWIIYVERI